MEQNNSFILGARTFADKDNGRVPKDHYLLVVAKLATLSGLPNIFNQVKIVHYEDEGTVNTAIDRFERR